MGYSKRRLFKRTPGITSNLVLEAADAVLEALGAAFAAGLGATACGRIRARRGRLGRATDRAREMAILGVDFPAIGRVYRAAELIGSGRTYGKARLAAT